MMAAIRAAELGQEVILIEKKSLPGRKLLLSGKGRCNLTNAADFDQFRKRFFHGEDFLRDAFRKFFNRDLMEFFEKRGLALKTERQERVFPVSDSAASILQVLTKELKKSGVKLILESTVKNIIVEGNEAIGVVLNNNNEIYAPRVILATGGASYAFTGSTGEGMKFARELGHKIIALRPGLVPVEVKEKFVSSLVGLSLKNIRLRFYFGKKEIISEIGELMFTRCGISGPLVLSLSSKIVDWLAENKEVFVEIDLKPGLSSTQLDARILREFKLSPRKSVKNVLRTLLPLNLISVFLKVAKIDGEKQANQVKQEERSLIVRLLKAFRLEISRTLPIEEAMVTIGGVSLKDINPRTMESRIVRGLYFAGEIMDIDADTGGFNLQAAFSTGYLAGESAALN